MGCLTLWQGPIEAMHQPRQRVLHHSKPQVHSRASSSAGAKREQLEVLASHVDVAVHQRFDSFLTQVLEEHRHTRNDLKEARNFCDILLTLPGEDGGPHLDQDIMKALTMDMISAGTDTSSITVEWGLSELLRNPQALQRVYQELDAVVGKERLLTESDLSNLPYFQAAVKETFRLHPAAPLLPHSSTDACVVAGFHIPAETTTFVNVWSIARDPNVWENPLEFQPERFLNSEIDVRGQHFQLIPFGSGRRACPGMHLGLAMVQYSLARLVHSFDWALPLGQAPHDLNMEEKFGITLRRAKPLLAVPVPRLPPHLYE